MLRRLIPILEGVLHYRNPLHIALKRWRSRDGDVMTIVDRATGVSVIASAPAYHMFGETWYAHDYDVPACPIRENDTVLDFGAHQGFFTCYAAAKGAIVHAFEPFPDSFERLVANVERNGFRPRVHPVQAAISRCDGVATMRTFDYLGGGSNTIAETHVADWTPRDVIEVPTIDVNRAIADAGGKVRVCKMDCEGSELEIVRAIADPSGVDAFALEFHPSAYRVRDLIHTMTAWGTHHVSFSRNSSVLYAVGRRCLGEYAAAWS